MKLTWAEETWDLLAERALWWPRRQALLVADLHLGKAATFRHHGIPIPEGAADHDLDRLSKLLSDHQAETVIFLGDLFHAEQGLKEGVLDSWIRWRQSHAGIAMSLVIGNHDRRCRLADRDLGLETAPVFDVDRIRLIHDPDAMPSEKGSFQIGGHWHPVAGLGGRRFGSSISLPAFIWGRERLILPAFGSFCGGKRYRLRADDAAAVCGETEVIALPPKVQACGREENPGRQRPARAGSEDGPAST